MFDQATRRLHMLSVHLTSRAVYHVYSFGASAYQQPSHFFNSVFKTLGLPWSFQTIPIESISEMLHLIRARDCLGACLEGNFTRSAMSVLDSVEPAAREIGWIDTVVRRGDQLVGLNAHLAAVVSILHTTPVTPAHHAVILGTGDYCLLSLCALRTLGPLTITICNDSIAPLRKIMWPNKTVDHPASLGPVDIVVICQENLPLPRLKQRALVLDLVRDGRQWEGGCFCYGTGEVQVGKLRHQVRELTGASMEAEWVFLHK